MRNTASVFGLIILAIVAVRAFPAMAQADQPVACSQGSPDERIAACTKAIEAASGDAHDLAGVFARRAFAFSLKGDADRALADCSEAIRHDPDCFPALILRGQLFLKRRDWDLAIADFTAALQRLGGTHAADGDRAAQTAFHDRGVAYRNKGDVDRGIVDLNEAIRRDPNSARAFANRGDAYRLKGDRDRALSDLNEALRLDPKYVTALASRGEELAQRGEIDRALQDLNTAIDIDPKYPYAFAGRSIVYVAQRDYDHALADLNRAIDISPREASFYNRRGGVFLRTGNSDHAMADFNSAIRLDPKLSEAYANRGKTFLKMQQYDLALSDLNSAIELDPQSARMLVLRGSVFFRNGDAAKASVDFRRASELDPKNAYTALWDEILARRGVTDSRLARAAQEIDMTAWPAPLVRLFLGQATPEAATDAAQGPDPTTSKNQTCEAYFYIGEWASERADKAEAARRFRLAADACPKNFRESEAAVLELKGLASTP